MKLWIGYLVYAFVCVRLGNCLWPPIPPTALGQESKSDKSIQQQEDAVEAIFTAMPTAVDAGVPVYMQYAANGQTSGAQVGNAPVNGPFFVTRGSDQAEQFQGRPYPFAGGSGPGALQMNVPVPFPEGSYLGIANQGGQAMVNADSDQVQAFQDVPVLFPVEGDQGVPQGVPILFTGESYLEMTHEGGPVLVGVDNNQVKELQDAASPFLQRSVQPVPLGYMPFPFPGESYQVGPQMIPPSPYPTGSYLQMPQHRIPFLGVNTQGQFVQKVEFPFPGVSPCPETSQLLKNNVGKENSKKSILYTKNCVPERKVFIIADQVETNEEPVGDCVQPCISLPNSQLYDMITSDTNADDSLVIIAGTHSFPYNITAILSNIDLLVPLSSRMNVYVAAIPVEESADQEFRDFIQQVNDNIRDTLARNPSVRAVNLEAVNRDVMKYRAGNWRKKELCIWIKDQQRKELLGGASRSDANAIGASADQVRRAVFKPFAFSDQSISPNQQENVRPFNILDLLLPKPTIAPESDDGFMTDAGRDNLDAVAPEHNGRTFSFLDFFGTTPESDVANYNDSTDKDSLSNEIAQLENVFARLDASGTVGQQGTTDTDLDATPASEVVIDNASTDTVISENVAELGVVFTDYDESSTVEPQGTETTLKKLELAPDSLSNAKKTNSFAYGKENATTETSVGDYVFEEEIQIQ